MTSCCEQPSVTVSESAIRLGIRDEPKEANELEAVMCPELQEHSRLLGRATPLAYVESDAAYKLPLSVWLLMLLVTLTAARAE